MLKRTNKITALLVAAASIMTMVPAMAADNNARIGNREGTVKQGIAYDDGAYSYYGYRNDTYDTGVWFNKGNEEKDSADTDLEDYRFNNDSKYGTKYAYAKENSNDDEYLVDLSTGKIVTDETAEEKSDVAQANLASKIKKADRYKNVITSTTDLDGRFDQILKGQFGDVWYQYNTNVAGTSRVGEALGEVKVSASADWNTTEIAGKTFNKADGAATVGFNTASDFAVKAATKAYGAYNFTDANPTTGKVTLTQKVAANFTQADADALTNNTNVNVQVVTPGVTQVLGSGVVAGTQGEISFTPVPGKKLQLNGVDVSATNAPAIPGYELDTANTYATGDPVTYLEEKVGGVFTGIQAPTGMTLVDDAANTVNAVVDAIAVADNQGSVGTAGVKAVVEVTPLDLTKDVKIMGTTIAKNVDVVTGYHDAAGLKTQLLAADLGNYAIKDNAVSINGSTVNFTLVQKVGATLNQGNVGFGTDGVTAIVMKNGVGGTSSNGSTGFTGFTDEKGTGYIDASYTANMRVYSTVKGRAIMVDEYDNEVEDAGLTVHLDSLDAIAQDKDNIYALAHVTVTGTGAAQTTQVFLQKISKVQGEKEEGAYIPKSVTSYQLDSHNIYDNDDMADAYDVIFGTDTDHEYLIGMEVKDGSLYVTKAGEDNVKVFKLDMKNVKSDTLVGGLKVDVDTNALVKDDDGDTDIVEHTTSEAATAEDEGLKGIEIVTDRVTGDDITLAGQPVYRHPSVSIDVDGNTWALDKGQIKMFTKVEAKNVNTCDRAMDAIDAYNASSVMAWDTDGDVYTTIQEGVKVTEGDGITVNPDINADKFKNGYNATEKKFYKDGVAVTSQWASDVAGKWYFLDTDGVAKSGWYQNASGNWYLLDATTGAMLTGWNQDGGNWYYLNPINSSGAMVTGWFQDTTGTWYYSDGSGKMLANTTVNGYVLGANGAWVK